MNQKKAQTTSKSPEKLLTVQNKDNTKKRKAKEMNDEDTRPKKKKRDNGDNETSKFDNLVKEYKQKLFSDADRSTRWFE